ncbi:TetR/AcrR family transcriptional regulator C-terminal domain-containing protein [Leifsonia sp. F6_8S_P_1B]|uniref:TetR/AcrR family transcriptional regulator C-terminal domain-containing protein n=1 Tax=Leifsonia williamsii TaxID=3035919 RepID=A0ABT8KFQ3_9MICO|nr:TetR/AcrR family transcriptional regulator C-terminal domain-containing protein [Leifsonia williamsii]MDN4616281.1 TetR/AcrR family transcriptional regulator C-terminal domain-containing protein [Leifsonia williamsii]
MTSNESGRRHTRDDVARTALRILDDDGLPDLTMRRLAAALDVQPSALYHHFPNKQTLLAELADRIVARAAQPASGLDWSDTVRAEAAALRDALLAYRDGAEVVSSTFALGLGAGAPLDRFTDAVTAGGFDDETARRAATALLHFVLGHVSHEQQRLQYDSLGVLADSASAEAGTDSAEAFAFGIDLLVGGLERVSRSRT